MGERVSKSSYKTEAYQSDKDHVLPKEKLNSLNEMLWTLVKLAPCKLFSVGLELSSFLLHLESLSTSQDCFLILVLLPVIVIHCTTSSYR